MRLFGTMQRTIPPMITSIEQATPRSLQNLRNASPSNMVNGISKPAHHSSPSTGSSSSDSDSSSLASSSRCFSSSSVFSSTSSFVISPLFSSVASSVSSLSSCPVSSFSSSFSSSSALSFAPFLTILSNNMPPSISQAICVKPVAFFVALSSNVVFVYPQAFKAPDMDSLSPQSFFAFTGQLLCPLIWHISTFILPTGPSPLQRACCWLM